MSGAYILDEYHHQHMMSVGYILDLYNYENDQWCYYSRSLSSARSWAVHLSWILSYI